MTSLNMDVIIDANILFAAIIKDSTTRKIICDDNINLFAPAFIKEEVKKYTEIIARKANVQNTEWIIEAMLEKITLLDETSIAKRWQTAKQISPDKKDIPYIAAALATGYPLWSNDKALNAIPNIRVIATEELVKILNKN